MQVPSPWPCPGTSDTACRSWSGQHKTAVVQDERLAPNVLVSTLTVVIYPRVVVETRGARGQRRWFKFSAPASAPTTLLMICPFCIKQSEIPLSSEKKLKFVQITSRKGLSRLWLLLLLQFNLDKDVGEVRADADWAILSNIS